jgi:hypothetical protein
MSESGGFLDMSIRCADIIYMFFIQKTAPPGGLSLLATPNDKKFELYHSVSQEYSLSMRMAGKVLYQADSCSIFVRVIRGQSNLLGWQRMG